MLFLFLPFVAAAVTLLVSVGGIARRHRSPAAWCFFAGTIALAVDSALTGLSLWAPDPQRMADWLTRSFVAKSFVPGIWLCFSLTYSRGDYRRFLRRWKWPLAAVALLPVVSFAAREHLFRLVDTEDNAWALQLTVLAKALNGAMLFVLALVLMNLEQTFRSAVGTSRWRIKFVVLGLGVIFATGIYVRTQAILFSTHTVALASVESAALLIGCACLMVAYARSGLSEIDVYPSLAVLRSSLTILVVGGYLFTVGVLAQVVRRFGGTEILQFQALVVLAGMTGLAVLLLSDRARQKLDRFVASHFKKAQHDSVRIWSVFSRRLASVNDAAGLCGECARLISETFGVLSVTVWLVDEDQEHLIAAASTAALPQGTGTRPQAASSAVVSGLRSRSSPFDLDEVAEGWAEEFRRLNARAFREGGHRLCVSLGAGEEHLGAAVLADRIGAAVYTGEELELLKCIGDQMASVLVNLRLASEVARARELDAFRTMSAFFVHDLKNAAASLNLTLKNMPIHVNDPGFLEDALRGVGNTARRIDELITRLSALRQRPEFSPLEADLNQLVSEALDRVNGMPDVELIRDLHPLPAIHADGEQIQSVVTNLVLNARDALGPGGRIHVRTEHRDGRVQLAVVDNGCGMTPEFLNQRLFRPFQSTKKKGLGIGLFQSRAIVQAHGGGMHVESEVGKGTTFLVSLPVRNDR